MTLSYTSMARTHRHRPSHAEDTLAITAGSNSRSGMYLSWGGNQICQSCILHIYCSSSWRLPHKTQKQKHITAPSIEDNVELQSKEGNEQTTNLESNNQPLNSGLPGWITLAWPEDLPLSWRNITPVPPHNLKRDPTISLLSNWYFNSIISTFV